VKLLDEEKLQKMLINFGISKDALKKQMMEYAFDPKHPEGLTILPTKKQVIHLNYMEGLAKVIGGEVGAFILALHDGEVSHFKSLQGMGLQRFTDILQNQQLGEMTIRNESIPQQLAEKQGFWSRFSNSGEKS
jgi:hypothetical protein